MPGARFHSPRCPLWNNDGSKEVVVIRPQRFRTLLQAASGKGGSSGPPFQPDGARVTTRRAASHRRRKRSRAAATATKATTTPTKTTRVQAATSITFASGHPSWHLPPCSRDHLKQPSQCGLNPLHRLSSSGRKGRWSAGNDRCLSTGVAHSSPDLLEKAVTVVGEARPTSTTSPLLPGEAHGESEFSILTNGGGSADTVPPPPTVQNGPLTADGCCAGGGAFASPASRPGERPRSHACEAEGSPARSRDGEALVGRGRLWASRSTTAPGGRRRSQHAASPSMVWRFWAGSTSIPYTDRFHRLGRRNGNAG